MCVNCPQVFRIHPSGGNDIGDLASVDSLNLFPKLVVKFIPRSVYYVSYIFVF